MPDMIYLAEITAYDANISATKILRYASGRGYVTGAADTPPNTLYAPRIVQPCNFTRTAFADARVMGGSTAGYGEMVLNNADQALAGFADYGLDGRACTVLVGPEDGAYPADFTVFLAGTIQRAEVSATKITLRLRDNLFLLSVPIQTTLYAGTNVLPNGAEGTANDIAGQAKPLTYGRVYHVPAVEVNTSALIYQVHDGAVQAIDAVFDGGIALTAGADVANLAALQPSIVGGVDVNQPAPGAFITCKALGLFRLGLIADRVTAHVQGDNAGGYVNTAAGIIKRILTQRAGISSGAIDGSFAALDAAFPAECGVFAGASASGGGDTLPQSSAMNPVITSGQGIGSTVQSVIDAVLLSGGCFLAPTRSNTWQIKQLLAPVGPPVASFTDADIISLDAETPADDTAGIPVYFVGLRYKRYPGFLQPAEVKGNMLGPARSDISTEWRVQGAGDSTVLVKHLLAARLYRDTCLTSSADAAVESLRLQALHGARRDFDKATVRLDETKATIELGVTVQLTTPKLGYDASRLFVVVGLTSDGRKDELTLDLWG